MVLVGNRQMNDKKRVIVVDDPLEETDRDFERRRRMVKDWHSNKSKCVPLPLPYYDGGLTTRNIKYCVFHKDTQLDENGLCPDCLEMVKKHTRTKKRVKRKR